MTRELPSYTGNDRENGKACCNMSVHDYLHIASDKLLSIIGKMVSIEAVCSSHAPASWLY
jgi:hypothetical protein